MKSSGFATLLVSLTAFSGFKASKGEWHPSYAFSNALGADDRSGIKFGPLRFVFSGGNQYGNDRGTSELSSGARYDVPPYGLPGEIARRLGDNDEYSSSDGDDYGRIRRLTRRRVIVIVVRRRRPRSAYGSGSVEDGDGWIRQGGDSEIPGPAEVRTFGRGGDGELPRALSGPIGNSPFMLFRNQHTGERATPFIGTPSLSGPSEGAGSASAEQIFGPPGLQVTAGSPTVEQSHSLYPNVRTPFGNAQGIQSGFASGGPYTSRSGPMVFLRFRRTAPESTEGSGDLREGYSSGYGGPSVDTYGIGSRFGGMAGVLSGRNLGVPPAFSENYDSSPTGNVGAAGMPLSFQQGPQPLEQKS
ncbi:hypothetical protein MTO96_040054 [Rhipicephalus appendiculatus]